MVDRYAPFTELVQNRLAVIDSSVLLHRSEEPSSTADQPVAPSKRLRLAAVEAQVALASQDRAAAERAVISMLNQMIQLARSVPWWRSRAQAAIADTVDYASGNHEVSSAPAQQAWDRYWLVARPAFVGLGLEMLNLPGEDYEALTGRMNQAEEEWLAAWYTWHAMRQESGQGEP